VIHLQCFWLVRKVFGSALIISAYLTWFFLVPNVLEAFLAPFLESIAMELRCSLAMEVRSSMAMEARGSMAMEVRGSHAMEVCSSHALQRTEDVCIRKRTTMPLESTGHRHTVLKARH
jgi:hypothetical protein